MCLTAVALVLQSGCATTVAPPVPSQEVRHSFGVVAIAPAQYPPQSSFVISWRHKEGATGTQAALMAGGGGAATAAMAAVAAPIALPVIVLSGVLYTGVMTSREAIYTSKGIVPADTAAEIESAINKAVAALDVQNALAARLAMIVKSDPQIRLAAVSAAGPDKPAARPDYAQLRTAGIDTVIEVAITEIGFDGCIKNNWECRPPHVLYLFMRAQARLVRVADGVTLFEWPLEYKGGYHELTRWFADGGRLLGEELEQTYRALAENVYDEAFLITPIALPFISDFWESRCWLEPLYPVFRAWYGSRVDKLQPTLRWTAFPRELDREKLDRAVLRKIGNVTYDLRIWDVAPDARNRVPHDRWRNRIVYERTGLPAAEHTLEIPLTPDSQYFWSMRARFVVDGRPMATRWARRSGCFSGSSDIMYLGYYEFKTPR
jgi:hypothetical protein